MKKIKKLSAPILTFVLSVVMTLTVGAKEPNETDFVLPEEAEVIEVIAEETAIVPEETETVPEESEAVPEESEAVSEETEAVSEETEAIPEGTETVPEEAEETAPAAAIVRTSGGDTAYSTLEAAISAAAENGGTVILTADYTLAEDTTIPTGVTVVVPYDATYSTGTQDYIVKTTATIGSPYVTLAIPTGKALVVNGTLLVNGVVIGDTRKDEGVLDGDYGHVDLDGTMTVNGTLYARGIIDGEGSVTAENGSAVYQLFQIKDWRGGNVALPLVLGLRTFPFNEYEVNNIRTAATYKYGSSMIGQGYVYANNTANFADVGLVGTSGLFALQNASSSCTSTYDAINQRLDVVCHGNVNISKLDVSVGSYSIDSSLFVCPVSKHIGITAAGGTLTMKYNYKLLPGSYLTVNDDATLTISTLKRLYVYDADAYQAGFTYDAPAATEDAVLTINGTASGRIYSSDAEMNNICGDAYTVTKGSSATVYEYTTDYVSVTFYRATLTKK